MTAKNRYFIKVFLLMGIPFGLIMGFNIPNFNSFDIYKGLFLTFFFGFAMAVIALNVQVAALKSLGIKNVNYELLGVEHSIQINSGLSINELYQIVTTKQRFSKSEIDEINKIIKLRKASSMFSLGETITIKQISNISDANKFEIKSKPWFGYAIMDDGLNYKNVTTIKHLIEKVA